MRSKTFEDLHDPFVISWKRLFSLGQIFVDTSIRTSYTGYFFTYNSLLFHHISWSV